MKTIGTKDSSRSYCFSGNMGEIELSFDPDNFPGTADSVIVFIPWGNGLITVYNPARGWEIPGGRLEPGETEIEAVRREAYEEAGCRLGEPLKFGQYRFQRENQVSGMTIALYYAQGLKLEALPVGSEMLAVEILPLKSLAQVASDQKYNPAMRDKVFALAIQRLQELGMLPLLE